MSENNIIFCPECGKKISASNSFCTECGATISAQAVQQIMGAPLRQGQPQNGYVQSRTKKKNSKALIIVSIITGAVALALIATLAIMAITGAFGETDDHDSPKKPSSGNTVVVENSPFDSITVEFSGENGKGVAVLVVNDKNASINGDDFTIENNGNLKNGDIVTVTFDDGKKKESATYTVYSLTESATQESTPAPQGKVVNPFEYVDIYFMGTNGKGSAYISTISSEFSAIYYRLEGANGTLKNGDRVIVKFDKEQFAIYHPEYTILNDSYAYTVSGLEGNLAEVPDTGLPYDLQVEGSANGYILPYSNVRYYDEAFLSTLTDKQLKFARNEITARHGRKFVTAELQNYFETTPWYVATYEPTYFDKYIFETMNEYEKGNMEIIKKIEQARKAN